MGRYRPSIPGMERGRFTRFLMKEMRTSLLHLMKCIIVTSLFFYLSLSLSATDDIILALFALSLTSSHIHFP